MTEHLLVKLAEQVRSRGTRFLVAIGPAGCEFDPRMRWDNLAFPKARTSAWDFDYPHRRLEAFLDARGIPWVSLKPALTEHYARTGRSGYFAWDSHWTAEGHRIVADALRPAVANLLATHTRPGSGRTASR